MRLIDIWGEGDFGFMLFEDSTFNTPEELEKIWVEGRGEEYCTTTREIADETVYFMCIEYEEVDPAFIRLIREKQDYDSSKHGNFVILEEKS